MALKFSFSHIDNQKKSKNKSKKSKEGQAKEIEANRVYYSKRKTKSGKKFMELHRSRKLLKLFKRRSKTVEQLKNFKTIKSHR